jgi:hypothetical protein
VSEYARSNTEIARITHCCRACGENKIVNAMNYRVTYTGGMDGWQMYSGVCRVCEHRDQLRSAVVAAEVDRVNMRGQR